MSDKYFVFNEDCLTLLKDMPDNSIDSLVTDPPAGIGFMGKEWDQDKGGRKQWIAWMTEVMKECLRVLKPGAHGLVWALPRTSHWTATALEDAGFEIRDVITHIFGTGFPKSLDISKAIYKSYGVKREITAPATPEAKQWQGWGTAIKPASEHWILIRKPFSEKTVAANVLKHGTGGINIDLSKIGTEQHTYTPRLTNNKNLNDDDWSKIGVKAEAITVTGRFPSNLTFSHNEDCEEICTKGCAVLELENQSNNACKFFYCAKASKKDKKSYNTHPTTKSTTLMAYFTKMITPPGGSVLDPFSGSGSSGVAAVREGFIFFGIEKEKEYFDIMLRRLEEEVS